MRRAVFLAVCVSLILGGLAGLALGDKLTITVEGDGVKPRTVTVDLPPAVPTSPATQPTTKPTPPPPSTAPSDPLPPDALYREIGGIPAGAKPVAGGELSKLSGDVLLTGDTYTASGTINANLYDPTPGAFAAKVTIPAGKQVTIASGRKVAGPRFVGGGLAKDTDGTHAAILTSPGVKLQNVEVTGAAGVGITFIGPGNVSYGLFSHHNGTSGRMMRCRGDNKTPGSGFHEVGSELAFNNHGGKKSDAANKGTQTSDYLGEYLYIHDEEDGGQWFDIACWNVILRNSRVERITSSAEWFRGVGVRFELNAWGTYPSGVYGGYIGDVAGSAVAVNESGNIDVVGVTFGPSHYTLELRQLTRSDDPGDGGTDPAKWLTDPRNRLGPGRPGAPKGTLGWYVYGVTFKRNTIGQGAGILGLSDSGADTKKITQSGNAIRIEDAADVVKIKIPK